MHRFGRLVSALLSLLVLLRSCMPGPGGGRRRNGWEAGAILGGRSFLGDWRTCCALSRVKRRARDRFPYLGWDAHCQRRLRIHPALAKVDAVTTYKLAGSKHPRPEPESQAVHTHIILRHCQDSPAPPFALERHLGLKMVFLMVLLS